MGGSTRLDCLQCLLSGTMYRWLPTLFTAKDTLLFCCLSPSSHSSLSLRTDLLSPPPRDPLLCPASLLSPALCLVLNSPDSPVFEGCFRYWRGTSSPAGAGASPAVVTSDTHRYPAGLAGGCVPLAQADSHPLPPFSLLSSLLPRLLRSSSLVPIRER